MRLQDIFIERPRRVNEKPGNVVSLFSGCGGFDLPFHQLGFNIKYFLEQDKYCCQTLRDNFKQDKPVIRNKDIRTMTPKDVFRKSEFDVDVLMGGPPCVGFSYVGYKQFTEETRKKLTDLYPLFLDYVLTLEPRFVVIENVRALLSPKHQHIIKGVKKDLEYFGYKGKDYLLNASDFGVPQNRKRIFLIYGRDNDLSHLEFKKQKKVNLWDAISDMPQLRLGEGSEDGVNYTININDANEYQKMIRQNSNGVFNHVARITKDPLHLNALKMLKPGQINADLPPEFQHRRTMNKFKDYWRRLLPNKPSPTIVAHIYKDGMSFIHPYQDRTITARESARIQSFPDSFRWTVSRTQQYKQIGNAVPPLLGRAIAKEILKYI